jgi:hypothetical protein
MLELLKRFFYKKEITQTGALLDDRKIKDDFFFEDIVAMANLVDWQKNTFRTFPKLNQNMTMTCGANALAKALGIMYENKYGSYIPFSRRHIYKSRSNKPTAGMTMYDMFSIATKGVTLEALTPKDLVTDEDIDNTDIKSFMIDVGNVFKISGGIILSTPNNIDTIASIIQTTGKGVILLTYFNSDEWSREIPVINDNNLSYDSALRHFVVATDYGIKNGVKTLKIEDSAWFGGIADRYLTEDWVKRRILGAGYPMNFKFAKSSGESYDGLSIISLQKCLRQEGLFPINISFVENYGKITRGAVLEFQKRYGLSQTGILNDETKAKLTTLYP